MKKILLALFVGYTFLFLSCNPLGKYERRAAEFAKTIMAPDSVLATIINDKYQKVIFQKRIDISEESEVDYYEVDYYYDFYSYDLETRGSTKLKLSGGDRGCHIMPKEKIALIWISTTGLYEMLYIYNLETGDVEEVGAIDRDDIEITDTKVRVKHTSSFDRFGVLEFRATYDMEGNSDKTIYDRTADRYYDAERFSDEDYRMELAVENFRKYLEEQTISSEVLFEKLNKNQIMFDREYRNKSFLLTGQIEKVRYTTERFDYNTYIYFINLTAPPFYEFRCFSNDPKVEELEAGDNVMLFGRYGGCSEHVIGIEDCKVWNDTMAKQYAQKYLDYLCTETDKHIPKEYY